MSTNVLEKLAATYLTFLPPSSGYASSQNNG